MPIRNGEERYDVALVGGGIMSATLGALIKQLMPDLSIVAFERLEEIACESSYHMNNAGTGHAGNCEMNYTPEVSPGKVDITKALTINAAFETSLQFWSSLVEKGDLGETNTFINPVPHMSFVWGEDNVRFLKARHELMSAHPMYGDMVLSTDTSQLREWIPLIMAERGPDEPIAATRVGRGTDVNFGVLSKALFEGLQGHSGFQLRLNQHVSSVKRTDNGGWTVASKDLTTGFERETSASFVFIGAGGMALPLLQGTKIPESRGYAGFPVSGQWLVCNNPHIVARHRAKVYGKASVGAPPMSVPHLDTRYWKGRPALLFGPYAGFTTKYLKQGSVLDLFRSVKLHNIGPMLAVARDNFDLTRYLIRQATQSPAQRLEALLSYMPQARDEDWDLAVAGQRVQIIKRDAQRTGRLQFGTEIVTAADGTLAALLGASPGASTAASTMLKVISDCFPERAKSPEFQHNLKAVVPSHGSDLTQDFKVLNRVRERANSVLGLGKVS